MKTPLELLIDEIKKKEKEQKLFTRLKKIKNFESVFFTFFIFVFLIGLFFSSSNFNLTGFFVFTEKNISNDVLFLYKTYENNPEDYLQNNTYIEIINLTNTAEKKYKLQSIKVSGSYYGNGSFKIFLRDNEKRFLIYDSYYINEKDYQNKITGFVIEDFFESSFKENNSILENNTENNIQDNTENNISDSDEINISNESIDKTNSEYNIEDNIKIENNIEEKNKEANNDYSLLNQSDNQIKEIKENQKIEYEKEFKNNINNSNQNYLNYSNEENYDINQINTESILLNDTNFNKDNFTNEINNLTNEINNFTEEFEKNDTLPNIIFFENNCIETCLIYNYTLNNLILEIFVDDVVLNLSYLNITFESFINEDLFLLNDSLLNITQNNTINFTDINNINLTNLTENLLNETINITINQTFNQSINQSFENLILSVLNLTNSDDIKFNEPYVIKLNYTAEINKPVLWKKIINLSETNYTILPKDAFNITINYINKDKKELNNLSDVNIKARIKDNLVSLELIEKSNKLKNLKKELKELEKPFEKEKADFVLNKLNELNKNLNQINESETINIEKPFLIYFENENIIQKNSENISIPENNNILVELTYLTESPNTQEKTISENKKQVVISSNYHYENVLAYTEIKESKKESIKVYWLLNNEKVLFENITYIDSNNNGLIDKLEWNVPHLSNQTFEISIVVLNPVTYLRDGETWVVAFNTTGLANLSISSTNANWTEIFNDNNETFDEMLFLNLSCGNNTLLNYLKIFDLNNNTYNFSDLENQSIKIKKFFIPNYECNSTAYFENYMIKAGYATLLFEFENDFYYVSDYAFDPSPPTHDNPYITPNPAYAFNNLTCNANNVSDQGGDKVINITTWYKNNKSIYLLYMPFEGGSNETFTRDYSGYDNNGVVNNLVWNNSIGKIDGGYSFNETGYISISHSDILNLDNFTMTAWLNISNFSENRTSNSYIIEKTGQVTAYQFGINNINQPFIALENMSVN
ncbi:MAG: hypothetical protein QXR96_03110, partial [Candidatus Woesearchaeota archaeon]